MARIATIGTFDGYHIGHAEVIRTLKEEALRQRLTPVVITFRNHPLSVVRPDRIPAPLSTPDEKKGFLSAEDVEVVMTDFTPEMAALSARQWLTRLRDIYDVRCVVIGYDNTFGSDGRNMTREEYMALGHSLGMEIIPAPRLEGVSSSSIRKLISAGSLEEAARLCGRPYTLCGKITRGNQLGRTIGFPTANLVPTPGSRLLPPAGVYVSKIEIAGKGEFPGVTNIGMRPSIDPALQSASPTVETHIPDFDQDIYDMPVRLTLTHFLRPERKFPSLDALKVQILRDIRDARDWDSPPTRHPGT